MEPAFWLERWDKGQIGFHQSRVNPYLVAHWPRLQVKGGAVFVPMCGKSLDMVWLRQQGQEVVGVEIASVAVRDFFAEQELQPRVERQGKLERWQAAGYTLWCGDLFDLQVKHLTGVTAVFDRASLIALPSQMRQRYVTHLRQILPTTAPTLLIAVTYPQHETQGPPFAVPETEIRDLYAYRQVEGLADVDVLSLQENARFRERGMTQMSEQIYRISHR